MRLPDGRGVRTVLLPLTLDGRRPGVRLDPPRRGEHTRALLRELGGTTVIGPMLIGMEKPVQIAPMTAIAPDVLTLAVLAAAGVAG